MTDKEKLDAIRAEIHRLVNVRGYDREMANDLFAFMDSLPNEPASEELEEASKKWLIPQLDKSYANYGEGKMMELTHFDGYAMLDAIEFGAKWQKEKEYTCYEEAFEDGAKWKKEQLIKEAIYGIARPEHGGVWCNLESFNFKDGDKVKVIVIKED